MEKLTIEIFNLLVFAAFLCFPFVKVKARGILALGVMSVQVVLSSLLAFSVFAKGSIAYSYGGSIVTGEIPVRVDYLSAWFMLIINFTFLTGSWYGAQYMKKYLNQENNLTMHIVALMLVYTSMIDICIVQNGFVMLVVWEVMALSSFIIIIFEHHKTDTLKAGINFLIQSHLCIVMLTIAFIWLKTKTGSFDFNAISTYSASQPVIISFGFFLFFFIGFAIKAGFVPFHTWLPLAHPAAPAHISGIMSGVIIKIGIYGIFRVLMLIKTDMLAVGYFIVTISVITGVYGVMLAIVQHNLKKLLAYHSIENIGIIGIGIGLGCLGLGFNNQWLVVGGFGGALLHTLNHSLFKSLLFYTAGNVYQATHTMNIEALGGLIKKMPRTAILFLVGSLAICGLPPFNGFVSEFFIYSGLFKGLLTNYFPFTLFVLFTILGLVLIGGLALICFTKAFGIVFLGSRRDKSHAVTPDEKPLRIYPLYLISLAIVVIGVLPFLFAPFLQKTVQLFQPDINAPLVGKMNGLFQSLTSIGWYSLGFIALIGVLSFIRQLIASRRSVAADETWGCGYVGETAKMQYTASSFIRSYRKLSEPVLSVQKEKKDALGLYPTELAQHTHAGDKIENALIDKPIAWIKRFLQHFIFLQNGNIQAYILYGFIFVGAIMVLPLIINKIIMLIEFFKQL
jgi:hydrogenase-4 component B